MRYVSTRSYSRQLRLSSEEDESSYTFEQALFLGYAPDSGLFVPLTTTASSRERLQITPPEYARWLDLIDGKDHHANDTATTTTTRTTATTRRTAYATVAYDVLRRFISAEEVDEHSLRQICERSFRPNDFDCSSGSGSSDNGEGQGQEVVPVRRLPVKEEEEDGNGNNGNGVFVAELFHGPTYCFKDLGMAGTVALLNYFAIRRRKNVVLMAATTGDTGPAAVRAVRSLQRGVSCSSNGNGDDLDADAGSTGNSRQRRLKMVCFFPRGQISDFQRRQMTTRPSSSEDGKNNNHNDDDDDDPVRIVEFDGGGDDMDRPIKELLAEAKAKEQSQSSSSSSSSSSSTDCLCLCGVNSYNIGRPLMQMVHFVWIYLQVFCKQQQKKVKQPGISTTSFLLDFVIPTGAMGNLTGLVWAKELLGLPVGKIGCATNVNDITYRVISSGQFHRADKMERSLSEAINIQVPYNFERILYYLTEEDADMTRGWMEQMERTSKLDITGQWLEKLQSRYQAARITDDELCEAMRRCHSEWEYFVDPHTAVAVAAATKLGYSVFPKKRKSEEAEERKKNPMAILATASPCKFQKAMTTALGEEGWEDYLTRGFPERGRALLHAEETPPIVFSRCVHADGESLESVQDRWKTRAQAILRDLYK